MQIAFEEGTYILAISGGVDSMVLLDLAMAKATSPNTRFIVAHYNHGIRQESNDDELFVKSVAEQHQLPFEFVRGELGPETSEEQARKMRYEFLEEVRHRYHAKAVVTAHHEDDVIETVIINLLRGTGRLGLTSLRSRPGLLRPLLDTPKSGIQKYAQQHNVQWREDKTNSETVYLRNRVRKLLADRMDDEWRAAFLAVIRQQHAINTRLDAEFAPIVSRLVVRHGATVSRSVLVSLSHDVAMDLMAAILRRVGIHDLSSAMLERLVLAGKALRPGKRIDIDRQHHLLATKRSIRIVHTATGKALRV